MSHVVSSKVRFTDLDALEAALKIVSGGRAHLLRDQKTWKWYGTWVNDYSQEDAAYKLGIDPKDYGKCDSAIHLDGCSYEIGLYKRGNAYICGFDFWGSEGNKLRSLFGQGLEKLGKEYARQATVRAAERLGYSWTQTGNKIVINTGTSGNAWGPKQQKGWVK